MRRSPLMVLLLAGCLIAEEDHQAWIDADGDGVLRDVDCDDADPDVGAGATWLRDEDGDGFAPAGAEQQVACEAAAGWTDEEGDCDDGDAAVYPGAGDACYDGVDADCAGDDDYDCDGDGFAAEDWGEDCDDDDPAIHPGVLDAVDGVDNDCDGALDWVGLADGLATLVGEEDGDLTGRSVAGPGDVDGDGQPDLLVGTDHSAESGATGKAFLVLGPTSGEVDLSEDAVRIDGTLSRDKVGYAVARAGDTDGDGLMDFLVGGYMGGASANDAPGEAYLFPGQAQFYDMDVDDAALTLRGEVHDDRLGYDLCGGQDADGDGLDEFAATASAWGGDRGKVYLVRGGQHAGLLDAADAEAAFEGATGGDRLGRGLTLGDLDGDGLAELILGAKGSDLGAQDAGAVYVFAFAAGLASRDLADADALLLGEREAGEAGGGLAAGDLDDDGRADLLVGAENADVGAEAEAGVLYLVPGAVGFTSGSLADAPGRLEGEADCNLGRAVAVLDDFDGDGGADLALGAPRCSRAANQSGLVAVLRDGLAGAVGLADVDLVLSGEAADERAGWSLAPAGDVDGDGRADLLTGAYDATTAGPGRAYLFAGASF